MACPALGQGTGFVGDMLRFVDCEVQSIGANAYQALAAPGSYFMPILTGMLTLFVALFGYRVLLGHSPGVRDGVVVLVKIGIVLVLATSWPAYRTLVYDVALRGPAEVAATIGAPAALPGASGGMVSRLEFADRALVALAVAGTGEAEVKPPQPGEPIAERHPPPPFGGFDAFAFGSARILFLIGVIGAFAAVRIIAGLMLALAPFFFAFLMFDATRGLFEGWLRVLAGAVLGALGTAIILGIELALIEPWLIELLTIRANGEAIPDAPVEVLVVTLLFCLVLAAMLYATARVTMGFRFAPLWQVAAPRIQAVSQDEPRQVAGMNDKNSVPSEGRSRAAAVVDAVAASQRRENVPVAVPAFAAAAAGGAPSRVPGSAGLRDMPLPATAPLGQSFRRRTGMRASSSATRRDRTP